MRIGAAPLPTALLSSLRQKYVIVILSQSIYIGNSMPWAARRTYQYRGEAGNAIFFLELPPPSEYTAPLLLTFEARFFVSLLPGFGARRRGAISPRGR